MRRPVLLALATGLVAVAGVPALADDPQRTAWYSALTVGPITAPAPTVAEGDLRVAGTGERPTAYATLALTAPPGAGGELVVAVRRSTGTPELAACPTTTSTWEEGGNQPFAAGPGYDCTVASAFGTLSADGTSVSFPLDASLASPTGGYSIALAPLPESTAPFSIDLGDPAFAPEPGPGPAAEPDPAPEAAHDAPDAAEAPDDAGASAEVPPADGLDSGSTPALPVEQAPVPDVAVAEPPELLSADAPPQAPADAPLAAPPAVDGAPPEAPQAVLPGARLAAAGQEEPATGPRLLALLTLVGVSAAAGYAAGQQRPAPRLLGGRARALPAGGPAPGAVLAVPEPRPAVLPRGIGRFSRVRDAAPRRLR